MSAPQRDEQELAALDWKSFDAEDKGSEGGAEELEPILADDFRIIRSTGVVQNKREMIAQVAADTSRRNRQIEESDVRVYGSSGVVTSRIALHERGGEISGHFWNTKVFVKRQEAWRCVAWQVTRVQ